MAHGKENEHGELGHILPFSLYRNVFLALIVLTVITVVAAQFDFGTMNMVIAMGIASVKAFCVAAYFMHLRYEDPLTWLFVAFPIILLLLLIGMVFLDNPFRGWIV